MLKIIFIFIFSIASNYSMASGPSCQALFPQTKKEIIDTYAVTLDQLNKDYNSFLFNKNLTEVLNPDTASSPFFERTQARYQAYKLRKILNQLFEHDSYSNPKANELDRYSIEKLAVKIEKLTFLADESVTTKMSIAEKIVYRQAQHSLLAQGLEQFLFSNESKPSPSVLRKVYSAVMTPFRDQYFRWVYAIGFMPKLNGFVIPLEVIERVVWNGYAKNTDLLRPYLAKTQTKYFFNVFSSTYNWVLAGIVLTAVGNFAHSGYYDVYLGGQAKAQEILAPTLANSEKMAATDWGAFKNERRLKNRVAEFKIMFQREPSNQELELLKLIE